MINHSSTIPPGSCLVPYCNFTALSVYYNTIWNHYNALGDCLVCMPMCNIGMLIFFRNTDVNWYFKPGHTASGFHLYLHNVTQDQVWACNSKTIFNITVYGEQNICINDASENACTIYFKYNFTWILLQKNLQFYLNLKV